MSQYYDITRPTTLNRSDRDSRYLRTNILTDKETREKLLESWELPDIPMTARDTYHTVLSNEECRPDILANNAYGNPLLWWVILRANNIRDPFKGPLVGQVVRIPSMQSLYGEGGVLL